MNLKDNNIPGLIFSGTKRGHYVFLSSNIVESNEQLTQIMPDLRAFISLQRIDHEFYCFDYNINFRGLSIVRSLNDALNRMGYLAITLVTPRGKTYSDCGVEDLLKEMLDLYAAKYVTGDFVQKVINPTIREDISLFENLVKASDVKLGVDENETWLPSKPPHSTLFLKYDSAKQLKEYFLYYDRKEMINYERAFILPDVQNDLTANITFTTLPPPDKKITYHIKTVSEHDGLHNVNLTIKTQKSGIITRICNISTRVRLYESDRPQISAEREGFEPQSIDVSGIPVTRIGNEEVKEVVVRLKEIKKEHTSQNLENNVQQQKLITPHINLPTKQRYSTTLMAVIATVLFLGALGGIIHFLRNDTDTYPPVTPPPDTSAITIELIFNTKSADSIFSLYEKKQNKLRSDSVETVSKLKEIIKSYPKGSVYIDSLIAKLPSISVPEAPAPPVMDGRDQTLNDYKNKLIKEKEHNRFDALKIALRTWKETAGLTQDQLVRFEKLDAFQYTTPQKSTPLIDQVRQAAHSNQQTAKRLYNGLNNTDKQTIIKEFPQIKWQ